MPATFYTLSTGDIFRNGGGASHLVSIPTVESIVSSRGLAVYNSISLQLGETIQYFLTFDDVIKYIHFGKGVGAFTVEGTMYCDCDGNLPGISRFTGAFSALRGKSVNVILGGATFTCILTQAQLAITGDPDTMAQFSFSFSVVNHGL